MYGNSTELRNNKAIKHRAKRKTITPVMSLNLIDVAKKNRNENIKSVFANILNQKKKERKNNLFLFCMF